MTVGGDAGVDEVQSVANPGVDSRHQISIILDLMAYHAATEARGFLFAVIDMVRGFPTALRDSGSPHRGHRGL